MIYAGILAGGKGTRMGQTDLPKQFLMLGEKPIVIHTIEQFIITNVFDLIIVSVSNEYITYMNDLIKKHIKINKDILVIEGGKDRNQTLMNICNEIKNKKGLKETDIVVSHDAVRPFVTQRIIKDNIDKMKYYDAVNTVIPAIDTIVESLDGKEISNIPNRKHIYQGQTPQTFNIIKLMQIYQTLNKEEKEILTDAAKIFSIKNQKVGIVKGEVYNFKITNRFDYKMANIMIKKDEEMDKND